MVKEIFVKKRWNGIGETERIDGIWFRGNRGIRGVVSPLPKLATL